MQEMAGSYLNVKLQGEWLQYINSAPLANGSTYWLIVMIAEHRQNVSMLIVTMPTTPGGSSSIIECYLLKRQMK